VNVLLIPVGSSGDVYPFIGIGQTLKKRGHTVSLITNGHFRGVVERAGLRFVQFGTAEEYLKLAESPDLWHPTKALPMLLKLVADRTPSLYELIRANIPDGETVVAAGSLAWAARIAQEKTGVPTVMTHLQPSMFRSAIAPPVFPGFRIPSWLPGAVTRGLFRLGDVLIDNRVAKPLNSFRATLGLAPAKRFMGDWLHSSPLTLGLFPDWYCPPQKDWPPQVRLTGFPLFDGSGVEPASPGVDDFLDAGEPPVVFTAGTAMKTGADFFRESVEACRQTGVRGVLLTQFPDQLPKDRPDSVRHFSYAPFSRVFPRAAAIVHHGGIGTTAQALRAGRPQLIMPFSHDQPDNADRVQRLGCGEWILPKDYKASRVAAALRRLIDDREMNAACKSITGKFQGVPALEKTCDLIEWAAKRTR
jgi:rhamnosyltransferase subunit B